MCVLGPLLFYGLVPRAWQLSTSAMRATPNQAQMSASTTTVPRGWQLATSAMRAHPNQAQMSASTTTPCGPACQRAAQTLRAVEHSTQVNPCGSCEAEKLGKSLWWSSWAGSSWKLGLTRPQDKKAWDSRQ
eukprot:1175089-Pyramimonas_sp.AAC.1